jgi:hypothetical protein
MKPAPLVLLALALAALTGCATAIGPVEVTRFHDAAALARVSGGTVAVEAAPGQPGDALELASYKGAVARELVKLGYAEAPAGQGALVALVGVERIAFRPDRARGPVSVGVGGGTGGYGSGVGVGIGLDLSGPPPEQVTTRMQVTLRERAGNLSLWEGRASFTVRADAPLAQTSLGAAKIAEALFRGFPGNSGETVEVP